jgi:hypothetical protein
MKIRTALYIALLAGTTGASCVQEADSPRVVSMHYHLLAHTASVGETPRNLLRSENSWLGVKIHGDEVFLGYIPDFLPIVYSTQDINKGLGNPPLDEQLSEGDKVIIPDFNGDGIIGRTEGTKVGDLSVSATWDRGVQQNSAMYDQSSGTRTTISETETRSPW